MIINNFLNKIKSKYNIDNEMILYIFIIIIVGFASFFLGRISIESKREENSIIFINQDKITDNIQANALKSEFEGKKAIGNFVASKNGKLYYPVSCKLSNRLAEKNKVYFDTKEEAEGAGFTFATNCK
jgi:hypothetical protein